MAGRQANYPITLLWPSDVPVGMIAGRWARLSDGRIEATYDSQEELRAALECVPPRIALDLAEPGGAPKDRPGRPCTICGCNDWWQRPPLAGGGWLCNVCHPNPAAYALATIRR